MAKKAAISGILPRTRHILPKRKTFWEQEAENKVEVGFKDPDMIPKKVVAQWTPKHEKNASERIAHSAKDPVKAKKSNSETQKWKNLTSDIRRQYFKDSLTAQESRDIRAIERREENYRKAQKERLAIDHSKESEATRLTLPTIESFFDGPFIQARTPEQQEELSLKRQANRLHHDIKHKQQKAVSVLELYQQSQDFIVNEEELNQAIDKAFLTFAGRDRNLSSKLPSAWKEAAVTDHAKVARDQLTQQLLGTTSNNKPGLPQVEDALSGKL